MDRFIDFVTNGFSGNVFSNIAATFLIGLVVWSMIRFRDFIFFKRVEYELLYEGGSGSVEWDIQWEDERLTIKVTDVSNDYLAGVEFRRNKRAPTTIGELSCEDTFQPLFKGRIQMKLNSIVRRNIEASDQKDYLLRFVFRRRRWF